MILNYIKIAIRNLSRQKGLAFINIFGLSVGIACFSLFLLYAVNELSFDNFHANEKNVYRVFQWNESIGGNPANAQPNHPMLLGPAMKQDLPGIDNYVRFLDNWGTNFIKTDHGVFRDNVSFTDPAFFNIFSFKLKSGDPAHALKNLQSIVLTETEAKKLFGTSDAVGKILSIKGDSSFIPFTVTAIAKDVPSNSTLQFSLLANFEYWMTTKEGRRGRRNWNQVAYQTFVQLEPGSSLRSSKKIPAAFRKKYYPDEEREARINGYTGKGPAAWYGLQTLRDMHTNTFIDGAAIDPNQSGS
jgi:putative ABC transport system permease protein